MVLSDTLNLQDILRAQDVHRWTIVRTIKHQTLAEHTFNVTMIARAICKVLDIDDTIVMKMAMEHDLDEIKTGDVPTPAKRRLQAKGLDMYSEFDGCKRYTKLPGEFSKIVKAADVLESAWFLEENKVGRHSEHVYTNIIARLHEIVNNCDDGLADAIVTVANRIFTGGFKYE